MLDVAKKLIDFLQHKFYNQKVKKSRFFSFVPVGKIYCITTDTAEKTPVSTKKKGKCQRGCVPS